MAVNINGGPLQFDVFVNAQQFNAAISSIERQLQGLTTTAEKEATAIDNLVKRTANAIAGYATFAAGTNFVKDIVRVRGEFQQLEVAFSTMLGSKEKADKLLAEVTRFAATTPFELKEVAGATKQLLAFGIGADKIEDTLRSLGDVSAGIGAPLSDIAYLYGTIRTQGVALTQDVRQFAQRGIPVYEELAKILGVSTEQVGEFITAGKIGFPEIEQVFKNLTAEGSRFGGLMEAQSKTLTGQISNLSDAWNQMLNDIGKSGEGIFADGISAATALVKNYETVVDILKLLVITYGSYRAALIVANIEQAIATAAAKGYTIAETLRYQAMVLSEKAMKILNKTMLSNPFVAVATAMGLLIGSLLLFNKTASDSKSKSQLLADAQEKVGDRLAETEAKIRPYLEALKNANLSEQDRVTIYEKLKAIDPDIIKGLNAKKLSYESLAANVNIYLDSLRKQIALEANKEALTSSIKQEQEIQKKIEIAKKRQLQAEANAKKATDAESRGLEQFTAVEKGTDIKRLEADLATQKKVSQELGAETVKSENQKQEAKQRTLEVIDEEIKAEKQKQVQFSKNAAEYKKYQENINKLELERSKITGKATKDQAAATKTFDQRADQLKQLIEELKAAEDDARRSGLSKEQSEIDRLNVRYDELKKRAIELKAGVAVLDRIEVARTLQTNNIGQKEKATSYLENLQKEKKAFDEFEKYKAQVGEQNVEALLKVNADDYESYIGFLYAEFRKLKSDNSLSGQLIKQGLIQEIKKAEEEASRAELETNAKNIENLLAATVTFNDKRAEINKKYDQLEATARKTAIGEDLKNKLQLLQDSRKQELTDLDNDLIRQSDLYKKLNQDIIGYTRDRLKEEIKLLKEKLKTDTTLTPQQKADIQGAIDSYGNLLDETNKVYRDFTKLAGDLSQVSGIFGDLSGAVSGINDGLSDTLATMGELVGVASSAANAIAQFAAGNIIGGIAGTVQTLVGVLNIGKKAKESREKAAAELLAFNQTVLAGEIAITQEYRNRQREQAKLNKLKLEGLEAEKKLLQEQQKLVTQQYETLLKQLSQETFVSGLTTEQYGGFLGIGRKTRTVEIRQSLNGLSFEEMEKLFSEGRLTGRAKELFEQLQKIKQEGVDIDGLLADNAEAAQQIFTGTTADSIVDSIADGFAQGKRSINDFAGNFEELMRQAMINSLKYQYLEEPLNEFYKQFAAASESGGSLTSGEISQLQNLYNSIIQNAQSQFDQLQQISGLNLSGNGSSSNTLTGAIKGMTEQQAELLAGQFGGLRITALDQLNIARQQLSALNLIQVNTSIQIVRLDRVLDRMQYYFETKGIKIA